MQLIQTDPVIHKEIVRLLEHIKDHTERRVIWLVFSLNIRKTFVIFHLVLAPSILCYHYCLITLSSKHVRMIPNYKRN